MVCIQSSTLKEEMSVDEDEGDQANETTIKVRKSSKS